MSAPPANDSAAYPSAPGPTALPLREARTRLSVVLQAVPDFLFLLDGEGRVLDYRAPQPESLYILDPQRFMGQKVIDMLPEPAATVVRHAIAEATAKGFHRGAVYSLPMPDGEQWYDLSIAVQGDLRTDEGRLVAFVRNITSRIRAENELRESERARSAINDNLPDGMVYQLDSGVDGRARRYTYLSKGVESLHGVATAEMMADSGIVYRQVLEEDRARLAELETRALETMMSFRVEVRLRMPAGDVRWRLFNSAPRRLLNGHVVWDGVEIDVTDRKQAEEALRQSEARYRFLFESMREGFAQGNLAGHILETNLAFQTMTGYSAEELRGMPYQAITPPPWHAMEAKILEEQVFSRGYSDLFEKEYVRKDGTIFPIAVRTYLMRDDSGRPTGIWGLVSDISARKRAEEALRQSEAKYRVLIESMQDAIAITDMHGRLQEWNPAFEILLGYSKEELRGLPYSKITPARWRRIDDAAIRQVRRRGFGNVTEKEYRRKDGTLVSVEIRGTLMRDKDGRPAGICAVIRNITARKRAEQALREAHDKLEERVAARTAELETSRLELARREEQFRQMAQNIQDGFWLGDVKTRKLLYVNPAFERIWNRPVGKPATLVRRWFAAIHPEDRERVRRYFRFPIPPGAADTISYRLRWPDGSIRWIEASMATIHAGPGHALRTVGVTRDVTEHRRLEEALLNAGEAERQRIGRDLHDGLGQSLTAIRYMVEAVHADCARAKRPAAAELGKIARLIDRTAGEAHALSHNLLPLDLKRQGLAERPCGNWPWTSSGYSKFPADMRARTTSNWMT